MALNANALAQAIHDEMEFTGEVSKQMKGWAKGVIDAVKQGIVNNPPGTISGITSAGGPLSAGQGMGGMITAIIPTAMANNIKNNADYPNVSKELNSTCTAISTHIMTGIVMFQAGNITGQATSSPITPGPLSNGEGKSGKIMGLNGSALASMIHGTTYAVHEGPSKKLRDFCNALIDYISNNAEISYSSGSVIGLCPPGGGPLAAGVGIAGKIS